MTRIRLGTVLAGAAVVVSVTRHLVASRHQAGLPAPAGADWITLVDLSGVAWAALEALTMFHLWSALSVTRSHSSQAWLIAGMVAILVAIAIQNAPSLIADSAHMTLVDLLGVGTIAHWTWAIAAIAANGLVVIAAGAADVAANAGDKAVKRAELIQESLTDALDRLTQAPAAVAAQQITVNVGQDTAGASKTGGRQGDASEVHALTTNEAVARALSAGQRDVKLIAAGIGVTPGRIRQTPAWKMRDRGTA